VCRAENAGERLCANSERGLTRAASRESQSTRKDEDKDCRGRDGPRVGTIFALYWLGHALGLGFNGFVWCIFGAQRCVTAFATSAGTMCDVHGCCMLHAAWMHVHGMVHGMGMGAMSGTTVARGGGASARASGLKSAVWIESMCMCSMCT
jgi:hypothetical protein